MKYNKHKKVFKQSVLYEIAIQIVPKRKFRADRHVGKEESDMKNLAIPPVITQKILDYL